MQIKIRLCFHQSRTGFSQGERNGHCFNNSSHLFRSFREEVLWVIGFAGVWSDMIFASRAIAFGSVTSSFLSNELVAIVISSSLKR